jgi:DNA-binding XRE family transcriptional regulator
MKITLKALRVNRDLTQEQAASALNITARTLQNWEDYKTFPNGPQLVRICDLYGCELKDIFLPEVLGKTE